MKNLADAAEELAQKTNIMTSYDDIQTRKRVWHYSPNNHLSSAVSKPSFSTLKEWKELQLNQRRYLIEQAGLDERRISERDLGKLIEANKKWPSGLSVVYIGGGTADLYTCNIFIGDSLYYAGKTIFGKYPSARDFYEGRVPDFESVDKEKGIKRGDVAAFGGTHVEIVTSVKEEPEDSKTYFCTRGAGHTGEAQGIEKCDKRRYVENEELRFLRLTR